MSPVIINNKVNYDSIASKSLISYKLMKKKIYIRAMIKHPKQII